MCESNKIKIGGDDYVFWIKDQLTHLIKAGAVAFGGSVYPQMGRHAGVGRDFISDSVIADHNRILNRINTLFQNYADDVGKTEGLDVQTIDEFSLLCANLTFQGGVDSGLESIGHVWVLVVGEPSEAFIELFQLRCERISSAVFREKSLVVISALSKPVLYSEEDLKGVAENGVIEITIALAANDCIVWRADDDNKILVSFVDSGGLLDKENIEIPYGRGIAGLCHCKGELIYVEKLQDRDYLFRNLNIDKTFNEQMVKNRGWKSALFAPLKNEQETFGVASVYSVREFGFSAFELEIFLAFAQRMTVAMAHALQVKKWLRANAKIRQDAPIYNVGVEAMKVAHDAVNKIGDAQDALNMILSSNKLDKGSNIYKNIVACSGHLSLSLRQLRLLTRAAAMQKKELKSESRKVKQFLSTLLKIYRDDPDNTNVELELIGEEDISFRIDEVQFSAALANIIENSLFFIKNEHSRGDGVVRVSYGLAGGNVRIEVYDNGPGIREEWMSKIFDFFFTRKGERGLGLGLGIAKSIIERHGGTIDVKAEWGYWTKFIIKTPIDNRIAQ